MFAFQLVFKTGGGMGKRPWVCTDRWGDGQETMGLYRQVGGWVRDHGYVQTGGGMGKRPWVCTDRWEAGQETMGL